VQVVYPPAVESQEDEDAEPNAKVRNRDGSWKRGSAQRSGSGLPWTGARVVVSDVNEFAAGGCSQVVAYLVSERSGLLDGCQLPSGWRLHRTLASPAAPTSHAP
jgi:hypothetical protein